MLRQVCAAYWLGLTLVLAPLAAAADTSPRDLIERMVSAAGNVSFHGVLVYGYSGHAEPLEIVRIQESGPKERLYTLRGHPREVFRDDSQVRWVLPEQGIVLVEKGRESRRRFTDITGAQLDSLDEYYVVERAGTDRVADRPAEVLDLKPRDEYRYGYRLWLDAETGLLIASECRNADGEVIEHFMFIELDTDPSEAALEPRLPDADLELVEAPEPQQSESDGEWRASQLPPGFELLSHGQRWRKGEDEPVEHLLYGDGFGAVSVYIAHGEDMDFQGHSGKGATRMAGANVDGHHITVVGEVPSATIEMVLSGMTREP